MKRPNSFCIDASSSIRVAMRAIQKVKLRTVLLTKGDKIVASVSEGDLLRALLDGAMLNSPVAPYANINFRHLHERSISGLRLIVKETGALLVPILAKDGSLLEVMTIFDLLDDNGGVHQ